MFCKNCGAENEDGVVFCRECGKPLASGTASQPQYQKEPPQQPQQQYQQPQQQQYQPQYSQMGNQPQQPQQPNSGYAIAAMVLGIVSIALSCAWYIALPCGIIAIVFSKKENNKGIVNSYTKAGFICGIIGACLSIVWIIYAIVVTSKIYSYRSWF